MNGRNCKTGFSEWTQVRNRLRETVLFLYINGRLMRFDYAGELRDYFLPLLLPDFLFGDLRFNFLYRRSKAGWGAVPARLFLFGP